MGFIFTSKDRPFHPLSKGLDMEKHDFLINVNGLQVFRKQMTLYECADIQEYADNICKHKYKKRKSALLWFCVGVTVSVLFTSLF